MAYERTDLFIFHNLGMNLDNLSEQRSDVFVCETCFTNKFTPIAKEHFDTQAAFIEQAIVNSAEAYLVLVPGD